MRSLVLAAALGAGLGFPASAATTTITAEHWVEAAAYSRAHGGVALRVEQGGRLLFQDFAPGFSDDTPHKIYSGTKSFVAIGVLDAVEDGLLTLDEPASATLTEWAHDRRREITIRQLLNQTSGLDTGNDIIYPARDQLAAAVRVPLYASPGTKFRYGPSNYQALGEILRRKLRPSHRTVEGYLRQRVFDPADVEIDSWKRDDAGNPMMHTGLSLTARQWSKFGDWLENRLGDSKYKSRQKKLLTLLFTGSDANTAYGLGFWLNRPEPDTQPIKDLQIAIDGDQIDAGGPSDLYTAIGAGKQRLYIIPSQDLVITRFGYQTRFSDGEFLSRLLTGRPNPDARTH